MKLKSIIDKMTLEQKVGQMFLISFHGTSLSNSVLNLLKSCNFGNVIIYADNIINSEQLTELTTKLNNEITNNTSIPPFIAIDHEGGNIIRIHDEVTPFPSSMAMTAAGDNRILYEVGKIMAQELLNLGINLNFAPVLDVNNNSLNPVIHSRAYSDNPKVVSIYAQEIIRGMQEHNILACGKHFPGHGDTNVDSHYGLPKVNKTIKELMNNELYPYTKAFSAGLDSIMTAHILYPSIEDKRIPATLSKNIMTNLLRHKMGFHGIAFSDSLQMTAIKKYFGIDFASVECIKAGIDIVITGINHTDEEVLLSQMRSYNRVVAAAKAGEISMQRINQSVERIINIKQKYKLFQNIKRKKTKQLYNFQLAQYISANAITKVKDELNLLPIIDNSVLVISPPTNIPLGGSGVQSINRNTFAYKVASFFGGDYKIVRMRPTLEDVMKIKEIAKNYNKVIIATSNAGSYIEQINLVRSICSVTEKVIVVATTSPYDLQHFPNVSTYICTYDYNKVTVGTLNSLLAGEINFNGSLPITIEVKQ